MKTRWPVFICYRQADGKKTAKRLYELLHDQCISALPIATDAEEPLCLDVYFDQAAAGVGDWTALHEPHLKRSRAFIVVCTPGAKLKEEKQDWVHQEIDWWLKNRTSAPILIDPLGQQDRYVPNRIAEKWPNAQRIELIEDDWNNASDDELRTLSERTRTRIIGGIISSSRNVYQEELEKEKQRSQQLSKALSAQKTLSTKLIYALVGVTIFLAVAILSSMYAYQQTNQARNALRGSLMNEAKSVCVSGTLDGRYQGLEALKKASAIEHGPDMNDIIALCLGQVGMKPLSDAGMHRLSDTKAQTPDHAAPGENGVWEVKSDKWQLLARVRDTSISNESEVQIIEQNSGIVAWQMKFDSDHLGDVQFHPEFPLVAISDPSFERGHKIRLFDFRKKQQVAEFHLDDDCSIISHEPRFAPIQFSSSGRYLVGAGAGGQVRIWDLHTKESPFEMNTRKSPFEMNLPDKPIFSVRAFITVARSIAFSPREDLIAAVSGDGEIQIWSVHDTVRLVQGRYKQPRDRKSAKQLPVEWPNQSTLVLGGQFWQVDLPAEITLKGSPAEYATRTEIECLKFSAAENMLAIGSSNQAYLTIFDLNDANLKALKFHTSSMSMSSRVLAFANQDRELASFDLSSFQIFDILQSVPDALQPGRNTKTDFTRQVISAEKYEPDTIIAAGIESQITVKIIDLSTGEVRSIPRFRGDMLSSVPPVFDQAGKNLAVSYYSSDKRTARLLDATTTQTRRLIEDVGGNIDAVLAVGDTFGVLDGGSLAVRNLQTDSQSTPLRSEPPDGLNWSGRYVSSPDGTIVAETVEKGSIVIWDLTTGKRQTTIDRSGRPENQVLSFDKGNERLAILSSGILEVRGLSDGERLGTIKTDAVKIVFLGSPKATIRMLKATGTVIDWTVGDTNGIEYAVLENWSPTEHSTKLDFRCNGEKIVRTDSNAVTIWDLVTKGIPVKHDFKEVSRTFMTTVDADATRLAVTYENEVVKAWDLSSDTDLMEIGEASRYSIGYHNLRLLPKTPLLLWADRREEGGIVSLFDIRAQTTLFEHRFERLPNCVAGSADAEYIAVCDNDRISLISKVGEQLSSFNFPALRPVDASLTATGDLLASIDDAGNVALWDVSNNRRIVSIPTRSASAELSHVALSRNGKWLAVGDKNGRIRLWSANELLSNLKQLN